METTTTERRTDTLKASPRMFESDLLDKLSRVHPSVPVKDMHELVAYGRTNVPIGYGTPGFGSSAHIGFELVRTEQNWPFFHVPYKGGGPAVADGQ